MNRTHIGRTVLFENEPVFDRDNISCLVTGAYEIYDWDSTERGTWLILVPEGDLDDDNFVTIDDLPPVVVFADELMPNIQGVMNDITDGRISSEMWLHEILDRRLNV